MTDTSDQIVFWAVVLARFLIPLTIPRFPLPGVIAALIIDAIDQTIFQTFTNLNLDGYQGYDKALDIYYLTIAYIATLRNWGNLFAFKVSRFLWYYRLFGVTLFELTYEPPGERWLLLIFPNTFEYFFIFYEFVRLRWDPVRLTKRANIIAAAFIWIFIKLPMEWWIHIAQLDMTDFLKENVFGVPLDATPSEILQANYWIIPVAIGLVVVVIVGGRWLIRKLPLADWSLSFDADAHIGEETAWVEEGKLKPESTRFFNMALVEKVVLVGLVGIIFAQILPDVRASNLELAVGTAFVIILNTVVSHWFARRDTEWSSTIVQFVVMAVINFGLVLLYSFLLPSSDGSINLSNTLFFVLLLTLIVTMFDRYYPVYRTRFAPSV
jgi:heme/copper-type cytochrome/quinol oxidase subunit 4